MINLFEVIDKTGRRIRLTKERWKHINEEHPKFNDLEEIKETLSSPLKVTSSKYDPDTVCYYYRYNKKLRRYVFIAVKYLNGDGFIITAYHMRNIQ